MKSAHWSGISLSGILLRLLMKIVQRTKWNSFLSTSKTKYVFLVAGWYFLQIITICHVFLRYLEGFFFNATLTRSRLSERISEILPVADMVIFYLFHMPVPLHSSLKAQLQVDKHKLEEIHFWFRLVSLSPLQLQRWHLRRWGKLVSLWVRSRIRWTGLPHQWVPGNWKGGMRPGSDGRGLRGERPQWGSASRLFQGNRSGSLLGRPS